MESGLVAVVAETEFGETLHQMRGIADNSTLRSLHYTYGMSRNPMPT